MRLFLAINLSDEMKDALFDAQNRMYQHGVRGNYTPAENLHLTLAFIGEAPDAEPIQDALSDFSFRPFELALEGMGCFGNLWWAGLAESAPLTATVRRLHRALAEHGIPFDRKRFSPHITLIRKASGKLPAPLLKPVSMTVDSISLMRSDRGRHGMIYTELCGREAQG